MQKEQLNHNEDLRVHHLDLQDYKLISILHHIFSVKIFTVSRIPQIIQNFKQRKVIDLSPYYFIFLRSVASDYMWKQAPFLSGALGPFACDMIILIQMIIFSKNEETAEHDYEDKYVKEEEEEKEKSL